MKPGKLAIKVPRTLLSRAEAAADALAQLPAYEVMGVSRKAVVRLALVEGAHLYLGAEAETTRLAALRSVDGDAAPHEPVRVESLAAAESWTTRTFVANVLTTAAIRFVQDEAHSKKQALDLRFPGRHAQTVKAAIREGRAQGLGSRGAVARLLIEAGILKVEARAVAEARRDGIELVSAAADASSAEA